MVVVAIKIFNQLLIDVFYGLWHDGMPKQTAMIFVDIESLIPENYLLWEIERASALSFCTSLNCSIEMVSSWCISQVILIQWFVSV